MHIPTTRTMGLAQWAMLFFLSLLWGGSFFFGKIALAELRPFTVVLLRVGIAALVLNLAVLAYVAYFQLLDTAGATNVMLVTFLIPVSALVLGALFLGESLDPRQAAGMGLIILGLAAIDGRLLSRDRNMRGRGSASPATSEDYSI